MAQNNSGSLLFVNKTSRSESLSNSRSDREDRKKINQFVQHSRDLEGEFHSRIERLKRTGLAKHTLSPYAATSQMNAPVTPLPTPPLTLLVLPKSIERTELEIDYDEEPHEVSPVSELTQLIPERGTIEPFGVCKVPLNNERYRILQYFVLEMFPAISRSDTPAFFTGPTSPGQQAVAQMIRDCLTSEMHTHALLTASTARMKYLAKVPLSHPDLPERYADTTMRLLRQHLSKHQVVDERLILTIFFLWAIESYRRDWKGVRTHQEMIKRLYTDYLGGFQNLSYQLRKILWFADRFQATATATPPVIEESWEPEDISPRVISRVLRAIIASRQEPMGAGFDEYTMAFFTPDFRHLLHEVIVLGYVVQCYWSNIKESYPDPNWVNGRSHSLLDRLLFSHDDRSKEDPAFATMLQECVRLALVTWLAFIDAPKTGVCPLSVAVGVRIRVAIDARPLRQHLASLIIYKRESGVEDEKNSIERLFLWIAGLGGLVSELQSNIEWFCQRFRELAENLRIDSWATFMPIERTFLWLDRLEAANDFRLTKELEHQYFEHSNESRGSHVKEQLESG